MRVRQLLFALACCAVAACARQEIDAPVTPGFKKVTLNASVVQTKSTIADDGAFSWYEGDVISVYATDGKFYDFTLESGQQFDGEIPESEEITTVAVYPPVAANGTNDGVFDGTTLNFTLPQTIEVKEGCSNIPMVASFAAGADKVAFKQIGAAFKFHVVGAPSDFYADFTFTGVNPVGTFQIDPSQAGEAKLVAAAAESPVTVTTHYTSDQNLGERDFYIPVATGAYTKVSIDFYSLDETGAKTAIRSEERTREGNYVVDRGDIFIMKELAVFAPMAISKVTPYFSDAKVEYALHPAATNGYAFYLDDAAEPVLFDSSEAKSYHVGAPYTAENALDNGDASPSGILAMGSTHTVAVAPVGADGPVEALKSNPVSFTLGHVEQLNGETDNKGPHQLTVWMVPWNQKEHTPGVIEHRFNESVAGDGSVKDNRVYMVQLFASDDPSSEPVYSLYTVDYQAQGCGGFAASSWIGKIDGNVKVPDRISLGYLDPGTTYYFRVRTIESVKVPVFGGGKTITISSKSGVSGWSELFPVTTEPAHEATEDEVLYEGFDDIMLGADFVNMATGLTPYLEINGPDKNNFLAGAAAALHFPWDGAWSFNNFNTTPNSTQWGLLDADYFYNERTGDLEGWHQEAESVVPGYGFLRFGVGVAQEDRGITSPALNDNLTDVEQICVVKLHAMPSATTAATLGTQVRVDYLVPDEDSDGGYRVVKGKTLELENNRPWVNNNDYIYEYAYQEVSTHVKLKRGYKIRVVAPAGAADERICLGDITVTIAPEGTVYDGGEDTGASTNAFNTAISEPGGVDYDVFKVGNRFPVTYWVHPWENPTAEATIKQIYDAGINVILPFSNQKPNYTADETMELLALCKKYDMRLIARGAYHNWAQDPLKQEQEFAEIAKYADDPNYVGHYVADEPKSDKFYGFHVWQKAYTDRFPGKVAYVNLFPSYANSGQLGNNSYEEYLDTWLDGDGFRSISFDFYPLKSDRSFRADYFYNLDLVRSRTLERHLHFWMIGNGGWLGETATTVQRADEYRWNAWSAIAMGSKGYSYYCYAFPPEYKSSDSVDDQRFIVGLDGKPTGNYAFAQELSHDIQFFGSKLNQSHADGGIMTPLGKYVMYEPRREYGKLTSVSGDDSIVGCFRATDGTYQVLVTNLKPSATGGATVSVTLNFDSTVTSVTTTYSEDGTVATVPVENGAVTLTFPEGEAYLVEWK